MKNGLILFVFLVCSSFSIMAQNEHEKGLALYKQRNYKDAITKTY